MGDAPFAALRVTVAGPRARLAPTPSRPRKQPRAHHHRRRPRRPAPRRGHRPGARRPRGPPPGWPRPAGPTRLHCGRRVRPLPFPLPGRHRGALPAERALGRRRVLLSAGPHQSSAARHSDEAGRLRHVLDRADRRGGAPHRRAAGRAGRDPVGARHDCPPERRPGGARGTRFPRPSWRLLLPPGTGEMQVGESDLSPDAIVREGDTVEVLAPLAPGQKQLSLEYSVTPVRGKLEFPVGPDGGAVNLLVEERNARVSGGTSRWPTARSSRGGASVAIRERSGGRDRGHRPRCRRRGRCHPGRPARARRHRGCDAGGSGVVDHPALVPPGARAPARADARCHRRARRALRRTRGRDAADEWRRYAAERARLKAELERALAARGGGPYS